MKLESIFVQLNNYSLDSFLCTQMKIGPFFHFYDSTFYLNLNFITNIGASVKEISGHAPAKWSRTVLECSKIILEFSRTMF